MNPFQHGEVFVTNDGAETDLDVGHYERFLDTDLKAVRQRHDRAGLLHGDRQGAQGRVPRRHGAGDPAHHQRDQGPDPRDGHRDRRRRGRRGDHRGRRHGRRHRVAAVPRGRAPGAARHRPRQLLLPARLAGAVHRPVRRAEDQAHPALGRRAAPGRHPARRRGLPGRPGAAGLDQAQDLADVRRRPGGGGLRGRRAVDLRHPEGAAPRGPRRLRRTPPRPAVPRRRLDRLGRPAAPGPPPEAEEVTVALVGKYVDLPRRLPVGRRGAAGRRVRPRRPGRPPLGPLRRVRGPGGRRPAPAATSTRCACPAASGSAASRARSARSPTPAPTASRRWGCASACSAW